MRAFVAEHGFALERVSPLAIANTARFEARSKGKTGAWLRRRRASPAP
jgi:hypothetical protein